MNDVREMMEAMESHLEAAAYEADKKLSYIRTFTGKEFCPFNPDPSDIHIHDIAHALARICRYAGHCSGFWSVAQHSLLVADMAWKAHADDLMLVLGALMHDAAEAYAVDMPSPHKRYLPDYKAMEKGIAQAVNAAFGIKLTAKQHDRVKHYDDLALKKEMKILFHPFNEPDDHFKHLNELNPGQISVLFLEFYNFITGLTNDKKQRG